jgi:hypothetical protein
MEFLNSALPAYACGRVVTTKRQLAPIHLRGVLKGACHSFALQSVGRFVESVEQHNCRTMRQLAGEESLAQTPAESGVAVGEKMAQLAWCFRR